jgi:hypothetical protein
MSPTALQHRADTLAAGFAWKPVLAIFLLAPAMAELLTSSTPPAVYFIPWVFCIFTILYGGSALLIREWAVRHHAGWPAVLLLGAAYGILEEGLFARSFFDPAWRAIGLLGRHGRAFGVNWLWALDLTVFHAAFSIGLTIIGVYSLFPGWQFQAWIGLRGLWALALLVSLDFLLMFGKGSIYPISPSLWIVTFLFAVAFVLAALMTRPLRRDSTRTAASSPATWKQFAVFGFSVSACYIALVYYVPAVSPSPWLTLAMTLMLFAGAGLLLLRWAGASGVLTREQQFGLFSGVVLFFALIAPLQDFNRFRPDPAHGMTLVGALTLVLLFCAYKRAIRKEEYE